VKCKYLIAIAGLLLTSSSAFALSCNGRLVTTGDLESKAEKVLKPCGEITKKKYYKEFVTSKRFNGIKKEVKVVVPYEKWTFNPGPNALVQVLTFENGELKEIETDGYGY